MSNKSYGTFPTGLQPFSYHLKSAKARINSKTALNEQITVSLGLTDSVREGLEQRILNYVTTALGAWTCYLICDHQLPCSIYRIGPSQYVTTTYRYLTVVWKAEIRSLAWGAHQSADIPRDPGPGRNNPIASMRRGKCGPYRPLNRGPSRTVRTDRGTHKTRTWASRVGSGYSG